jgi:DNA polymerase-3 subunit epsilon/ATP-dependent DNA helicase DinG
MRGVLVALDLETTGLDVSSAHIIEIGAVKFHNQDIIDSYTTLVDPGSPIPQKITAITGISQDKLVGAPKLNEVLPRLKQFVGPAPVVGHNVDFDMKFLQKQGLFEANLSIDTYEMASVLLPTASRYNLNALMQQLNLVPEGDYHRALADAQATVQVYQALWNRLMHDLPLELLDELVKAAQRLPWKGLPPFVDALQARLEQGERLVKTGAVPGARPPDQHRVAREPAAVFTPLDGDRLASQLGADSEIARAVDHYTARPQQIEMLRAVSEAFNGDEHLIVEAMPGTGRSLAYLLPAVTWAVRNGERIVISVNTASLQRQLLDRDIPLLRQALGLDIEAVPLKDREDYLCPRRLQTLRRRLPTSVEELRVFAKILVWLRESSLDDARAVSLRGPTEYSTWARLSAADEECTPELCEARMGGICPFYKAHRAAESAHLVIVNHSLLLSDALRSERHVLPEYSRLIVDEAHNLEEAATEALSFRLDATTIKRQLADLGTRKTGLIGDVLGSAQAALPANHFERVQDFVTIIVSAVKKMGHHVDNLFAALLAFLETASKLHSGEYLVQVRLSTDLRNKPEFSQVRAAWEILGHFTAEIADAMTRLAASLPALRGRYDVPNLEDLIDGVSAASRHLTTLHSRLNAFISAPDDNMIYWVEVSPDLDTISMRGAPLHIGPLVKKHLWDAKKTVVMTSATLRANSSFQYLRQRLGAEDVRELALTSPFNYEDSTLIFLPTDMPEPQERGKYQQAVERGIIELATATRGRLLVLFTGYTQLRQVAQNIAPRLALGNITVFDQSDGTSREMLLEGFRSAEKAVLLGTRSFWEDLDLLGDDLVALVIVRLPFAVPSDPVYAARNETFENSFDQFTIPDAILRFRQGFDRLIRARSERSIVVIFDKRMISKSYGQSFLDSLPACTVQRAPMAELGAAAKAWLGE